MHKSIVFRVRRVAFSHSCWLTPHALNAFKGALAQRLWYSTHLRIVHLMGDAVMLSIKARSARVCALVVRFFFFFSFGLLFYFIFFVNVDIVVVVVVVSTLRCMRCSVTVDRFTERAPATRTACCLHIPSFKPYAELYINIYSSVYVVYYIV